MIEIKELLNKITHADCLEVLRQLPDKSVDLILTDPPYGEKMSRHGTIGSANCAAPTDYGKDDWDDKIPEKEYFDEMFRVSKNQIIFGGNFMAANIARNSSCWIVWDKDNSGNYADCELAWTSFDSAVRKFSWRWNGMLQQDMKNKESRFHPTQKPVGLFRQILSEYYIKREMTGIVLDCFSGSGTTAVACDYLRIPFICIEKSDKYHKLSTERLTDARAQMRLPF